MTQRKPKLVVTVMKQVPTAQDPARGHGQSKNKGGKERGENAENAGDLSDPVHFW